MNSFFWGGSSLFLDGGGTPKAYTTTKLGALGVEEKKVANPELFFWQRVMAYYPLHFVSSALFAPMFIWVERNFKASWNMIAFRAFLNFSMLQAWFPKEAEIWNQPTWFLSALTFSNLTMPTLVLPQVANLTKNGLQKLLAALWGVSLLQKVSYSETARFHSSKEHPVDGKVAGPKIPLTSGYCTPPPKLVRKKLSQSLWFSSWSQVMMPLIWNLTRFHPIWALFEMTTGIIAARHVMLDTEEEKKRKPANLGFKKMLDHFWNVCNLSKCFFFLNLWSNYLNLFQESHLALPRRLLLFGPSPHQVRLQRRHHPRRLVRAALHGVSYGDAQGRPDGSALGHHQVLWVQDHGDLGITGCLAWKAWKLAWKWGGIEEDSSSGQKKRVFGKWFLVLEVELHECL